MTLPRKQEAAIVIPSCLHEEKMGECDQVSEVFVSFVSADSSPLFSITTFSTSATCMHTHTHVMQILNCAINSMNEKSLVCNVMKVWQCHYTSRNAFILKSSFNGTNGAKVVHKSGQNLLSAVNFTEGMVLSPGSRGLEFGSSAGIKLPEVPGSFTCTAEISRSLLMSQDARCCTDTSKGLTF
ncbi:uncharacterized protein FN964_010292 isoform 2-T3 [Alca torda]